MNDDWKKKIKMEMHIFTISVEIIVVNERKKDKTMVSKESTI